MGILNSNTIALAERYAPILDEVYKRESVTSILDTPSDLVMFTGANTAQIYKTQMDGKLCEINLDTLCENFEDGDVITIDSLKEKKLISQNAGRVKVLARGVMTKKLTIYADKFSIQAVKMIAFIR